MGGAFEDVLVDMDVSLDTDEDESTVFNATSSGSLVRKSTHNCGNSLFIVDWDDTLLATTWMTSVGILPLKSSMDNTVPAHLVQDLKDMETSIVKFLERCLELGKVAIVTNAESSWVELSAQLFVPKVCEILPKVRVLSARSSYQDQFPNNFVKWKVEAYKCVFREAFEEVQLICNKNKNNKNNDSMHIKKKKMKLHHCQNNDDDFEQQQQQQQQQHEKEEEEEEMKRFNVVSLGDSLFERDAMMELGRQLGSRLMLPKSVKFVERPSRAQLERQISIVLENLHDVYHSNQEVDLMLTVEQLFE